MLYQLSYLSTGREDRLKRSSTYQTARPVSSVAAWSGDFAMLGGAVWLGGEFADHGTQTSMAHWACGTRWRPDDLGTRVPVCGAS